MGDIPSELIRSGVDGTVKTLSALSQKIWEQKTWLMGWTKSLVRRDASDNLGLHGRKVDQPPTQGDASFGAGRSTVGQIFDCRVILAKHLEHQRSLYHNSIDFKNAAGGRKRAGEGTREERVEQGSKEMKLQGRYPE